MTVPPRRSQLLGNPELTGRAFCEAHTDLIDGWLVALFSETSAPAGVSLLALGGHGRREVCPQSDLDLILVHEPGLDVGALAESLWHPVWDLGLRLGHSVRTVNDTLTLAASDLETATALLSARHLAGSTDLSAYLVERARTSWRRRARHWLPELSASTRARHKQAGEVGFALEPDLKNGRGGLRDVHALRWAAAAGAPLGAFLDGAFFDGAFPDGAFPHGEPGDSEPLDGTTPGAFAGELRRAYDTLLEIRVELHRCAASSGDVLRLDEQEAVAAAAGLADADAVMECVAGAARMIAWVSDECWDTIDRRSRRGVRRRTARPIGDGLWVRDGRVSIQGGAGTPGSDREADGSGKDHPDRVLRTALAAARRGNRIDLRALELLQQEPLPVTPWTPGVRGSFVELLMTGPGLVPVVETLDRAGLWTRYLPEWDAVRSRPQRNALHSHTVDRHLLECVVRAAAIAPRTPRGDLLVLAALLHDIGKGSEPDAGTGSGHSAVGAAMAATIGARMGLEGHDLDTIVFLVSEHLLLSDAATRRDPQDPATVAAVARRVGDADRLALLRALSEADGLATGRRSWNAWKAQLVDQLASGVARSFAGAAPAADAPRPIDAGLVARAAQGRVHVEADGDRLRVVCPDRPGLFARIAGTLSLHGLDVIEANVTSSADMAIDEFRVQLDRSAVVAWEAVCADVERALRGRLALRARLAERARVAPRPHVAGPSRLPAAVTFDNHTASAATVLEAVGADRPGLLHDLARTLAELDLDVRAARIDTIGADVVDTFHLTDADGGLIDDPEDQEEIRRAVLHVLDPDP